MKATHPRVPAEQTSSVTSLEYREGIAVFWSPVDRTLRSTKWPSRAAAASRVQDRGGVDGRAGRTQLLVTESTCWPQRRGGAPRGRSPWMLDPSRLALAAVVGYDMWASDQEEQAWMEAGAWGGGAGGLLFAC